MVATCALMITTLQAQPAPSAPPESYRVRVAAGKKLWVVVGNKPKVSCTVGFVARLRESPERLAIVTARHCFNEHVSRRFRDDTYVDHIADPRVSLWVGSKNKKNLVPGRVAKYDNEFDVAAYVIDPKQVGERVEASNELWLDRDSGGRGYVPITSVNEPGSEGDRTSDRVCVMRSKGDANRDCGVVADTALHKWPGFFPLCVPIANGGNCVKWREADVETQGGDSGGPIFREWKRTATEPEYQAVGILEGGKKSTDNSIYVHISDVERVLGVRVLTSRPDEGRTGRSEPAPLSDQALLASIPDCRAGSCRLAVRQDALRSPKGPASLALVEVEHNPPPSDSGYRIYVVSYGSELVFSGPSDPATGILVDQSFVKDASGNSIIRLMTGAHGTYALIIRVAPDGVNDFGSLDLFESSAPQRFYGDVSIEFQDHNSDGLKEIDVSSSNYDPDYATGTVYTNVFAWTGTDYVVVDCESHRSPDGPSRHFPVPPSGDCAPPR